MQPDEMFAKLESFGITDKETYFNQAFSRNIGLFTEEEQERLSNFRIAIPGMGGVGGLHLITLTRTGITKFNIADFDAYEPVNINRQYGARVPDFGRPKLEVMAEQALSINPYLELNRFKEGINASNMDDFLDGVDVVLDGLDFFQFEIRRLLFKRAAEKGIHVITAGPMGYSSAMLVFSPNGMGFDEYFNIRDDMADEDKYLAFALGLSPRPTHIKYMDFKKVDFSSKAGPSLNVACQICSGMAATEAVKLILDCGKIKSVPHYFQYDPYLQVLRRGYLFQGNRNPIQKIKFFVVKKMMEKNKKQGSARIDMPHKPHNFNQGLPKDIIQYIVDVGTWAPSADNCQPWKFAWDGETLSLMKDPEKSGFFYDVNQESTFITFGALIENIAIAASRFGLSVNEQLFPEGVDSDIIARVQFQDDKIQEDPLSNWVLTRCVNRFPYNRKTIDAEKVEELKAVVEQAGDVNLIWIDTEKDKKIMQKIVFDADRILFEDKRLHQGLFRWLNLKGNDKKVGMNLDVLGLNPAQQLVFPLLADWEKMKLLNRVGASRIAAVNSVQLLKSSPAYALLAMTKSVPEAYIHAGRIMERFWIRANGMGLSVQPMAGFVFLLNHFSKNDECASFMNAHRHMIIEMAKKIKRIADVSHELNNIMFFRVGFAERYSKRTQRDSYP